MARFRRGVDNLWIVSREAGTGILIGNFPGAAHGNTKQERAKSAGERREVRKGCRGSNMRAVG